MTARALYVVTPAGHAIKKAARKGAGVAKGLNSYWQKGARNMITPLELSYKQYLEECRVIGAKMILLPDTLVWIEKIYLGGQDNERTRTDSAAKNKR